MGELFFPQIERKYTRKTEKKLIKENKIIKKTNLFYSLYAPDKIENWLEKMESEGLNLCKIGKLGHSFYFEKGEKRNVKYFTYYKHAIDKEYYDHLTQSGCKLIFYSNLIWLKAVLWSKEYSNKESIENCNEFYTSISNDSLENKFQSTKKMVLSNSSIAIIIVILFLRRLFLDIIIPYKSGFELSIFTLGIGLFYLICIIGFSSISVEAILYYFRIKK